PRQTRGRLELPGTALQLVAAGQAHDTEHSSYSRERAAALAHCQHVQPRPLSARPTGLQAREQLLPWLACHLAPTAFGTDHQGRLRPPSRSDR
ncbi:MAG: hypothetical protein MI674_00315, partial [Cytophagales bacterium]|nr:hypothetical protein [Cytophagales bacterium]